MSKSKPVAIYRPSRKKWFTVLLSSMAFLAIGIWLFTASSDFTGRFLGFLSIFFFGGSSLLSMAVLRIPDSSFLKVTPDGITIRTLWFTKFYRWKEIESFGVDNISVQHRGFRVSQKFVGFNYSPHYAEREETIISRINERLNRTGSSKKFDETLPDSYGEDPAKLAKRMKEWREQFL
jgi:hypothetical protein